MQGSYGDEHAPGFEVRKQSVQHTDVAGVDALGHEVLPGGRFEVRQLLLGLLDQRAEVTGQVTVHHLPVHLFDPLVFVQRLVEKCQLLFHRHPFEE